WSCPLSRVISAAGRSSPGTRTARVSAFVTTSSGNSGLVTPPFLSFATAGLAGARSSCSQVCLRAVVGVLPDDGGALAEADAHGGQPVPDVGVLGELPGELGHQPHAGGGERVADGDGAAPRVHPRVVVGDAEVVEEGEHLHGEGLIELEEPDVPNGESGVAQ